MMSTTYTWTARQHPTTVHDKGNLHLHSRPATCGLLQMHEVGVRVAGPLVVLETNAKP